MGHHVKPTQVETVPRGYGSPIVRTICGSHLYGTCTPESDHDYITVFNTSARRLLRQKYVHAYDIATNPNARNTKDDVDSKFYDLQFFVRSCLGGQTFALDLLYTPRELIVQSTSTWEEIIAQRDRLVTNRVLPFIGYCKSQASKYSAKGEKYNDLTAVFNRIDAAGLREAKYLRDLAAAGVFDGLSFFSVEPRREHDGGEMYLYGPNCAFPLNRRSDEVLPILQDRLDEFGERTKAAAAADGMDLKAYYHALRVVWQMEEYLTTGKLTFPCPRAAELLRVRRMEFSNSYIESWIEDELERVRALPNNLPEPDTEYWESWLDDKIYELARAEMLA